MGVETATSAEDERVTRRTLKSKERRGPTKNALEDEIGQPVSVGLERPIVVGEKGVRIGEEDTGLEAFQLQCVGGIRVAVYAIRADAGSALHD
ncbi:MAG: hypothetical protein WAM82_16975 [Thermoanaerobaculia bacterium]